MATTDKVLWAIAGAAFAVFAFPFVECQRKSASIHGPTVTGNLHYFSPFQARGLSKGPGDQVRLLLNDGTATYDPKQEQATREWTLPSTSALWATSDSGIALVQIDGRIVVRDRQGQELSRITYQPDQTPVFRTLSPNGKYYGLVYPDQSYVIHLSETSERVSAGTMEGAWLNIANDGTHIVASRGGTILRPDGTSFQLKSNLASTNQLSDDGRYALCVLDRRVSVIRISDEKEVFSHSLEKKVLGVITKGNRAFAYTERDIPGFFYDPPQFYGILIDLENHRRKGSEVKTDGYGVYRPAFSEDAKWLFLFDSPGSRCFLFSADTGRHFQTQTFDLTGDRPSLLGTPAAVYMTQGHDIAEFKLPSRNQ